MVNLIAYYPIFERPLIYWLGILTLIFFILTAGIMSNNHKSLRKYKKYHKILAKISLTLAVIHGTLGILAYYF